LGHQSGTQALHGLRLGERQAGRQLLGLGQRLAGTGDLALARRQLRLHEMGLGALRVQHQHLLDHGLRLLQAASLRRVIDLLQGGFGLRHRAQAGAQARTQQAPPRPATGPNAASGIDSSWVVPSSGVSLPAGDGAARPEDKRAARSTC
jgi:hypothetical protein